MARLYKRGRTHRFIADDAQLVLLDALLQKLLSGVAGSVSAAQHDILVLLDTAASSLKSR